MGGEGLPEDSEFNLQPPEGLDDGQETVRAGGSTEEVFAQVDSSEFVPNLAIRPIKDSSQIEFVRIPANATNEKRRALLDAAFGPSSTSKGDGMRNYPLGADIACPEDHLS